MILTSRKNSSELTELSSIKLNFSNFTMYILVQHLSKYLSIRLNLKSGGKGKNTHSHFEGRGTEKKKL
jgi:hypothetical protein